MGLLDAPVIQKETFGAKLRRLASQARERDPYSLATWTAPAAWAASTAYTPGIVVKNGANYYICIQAGTSAASGGPAVVNGRTTTDGTVLWTYYGPATLGATDPRAAAYSSGTSAPSGLSNVYYPALTPSAFKLYGAYATTLSTNYWTMNRFDTKSGTKAQGDARVSFWTDAPKFSILASATAQFRVRIDGRFHSPSAVDYIASGTGFHTFDFTASGGRRARLIEVENNRNSVSFYGCAVGSLDQVWAPEAADDVRALFISDSIMAGSSYGPFAQSVPQIVGAKLGWADCWNYSTGGTGYLNPGTSSFYTYGQRITEGLTRNPDIWVFAGSINDPNGGYTAANTKAAAKAAFQAIRDGGSKAPIVVFGLWSVDIAGIAAAEQAMSDAVTEFNDPLRKTFFVPIYADPMLPWVTHANNNAARTTSANLTMVTANDSTHPADVGTMYFSDRLARAIRQTVLPALN